jgi:hypothetical protein
VGRRNRGHRAALDDVAPDQQSQHPLAGEEIDYPLDADESPNLDDAGGPAVSEVPADSSERPPPTLRLRVAPWDLTCTIVLIALLLYLATATEWPTRLFGFLKDVCVGETCGPVPFGVDMYIYPVTWGGIGAALAAAGIGPFVSLLKGWYMSFWPVLSLTIVMVSSVAGSILTVFSSRYWL